MNKRSIKLNLFNWRNATLIGGSLIFIIASMVILILQRKGNDNIVYFENSYFIIATIFIIFLIYSLFINLFPIFSKFKNKKINSLNSKFTLYFISIALTPALIVGILGIILINIGINDWFNEKIKNVIFNSVSVAESYLQEHKDSIKGDVYAMSNDLNNASSVFKNNIKKYREFFRTQSLIRSLPETYLITSEGDIILKALPAKMIYYKPPTESLKKANKGELAILTSTQVNKVYALMKLNSYENIFLYAGRSMDPNVIIAVNDTRSAMQEFSILEKNRNQISIIFIILYLVLTLILILVSIIIGIRIAQRIVNPISSVIKASNKISKGNYDDKVERTNDYAELNRLADSFNSMSSDLVRQRNQLAIAKKHETWSDIARRIAHEIKNPLTPIQLSSERLLKKINDSSDHNDPEIHECVDSITRQVSEIGFLVDEFSNFARLPNPEFTDCNICSILMKCIDDIKDNYNNIIFDTSNVDNKFILRCDKSQIIRVFQNIIINSINSINESPKSNSNGNVIFRTYLDENRFIINISDNGSGLKYEKEELIKPYFTTRKKTGGTGLGLSIVEKILFDHDADFEINNANDGKTGAIASIYFNLN
tara:strand:+ start:1971 stop:3764 length:1794 start_codon:yes stop_codon:yes gene_type:complete